MRLLKVGRAASNDIVLNSDKVSSLHAEITILNNGDILLEDKNSTNGTFLMNKALKSSTSVSIRRGDAIRFADVELQWNQIPSPEDLSSYKGVYGIGSNFRNEIKVTGNTVSRFHATLKIGKNGKIYIQDHSKNGTTLNGSKIRFGENVPIKRSDSVACGGTPVDLKRYIPAPAVRLKAILATGIVAALVVLGVFLLKNSDFSFSSKKPQDFIPATVYVHGAYHYVVKLKDDPLVGMFQKINVEFPDHYDFEQGENGQLAMVDLGRPVQKPIGYSGTAFFVSKDGLLVTNRHVAYPWEIIKGDQKEYITGKMTEFRGKFLHGFLNRYLNMLIQAKLINNQLELDALKIRYMTSPIEISGEHDYIGVGYASHNYNSIQEFERCTVSSKLEDSNIDLGLMQLNTKKTPESVKSVVDVSKAKIKPDELKPLEETYYYIGYPAGLYLNLKNQDGGLKPLLNEVKLSKTPGKYQMDLQGQVIGGASGSPILNSKGQLVGVISASYENTTMSLGVLAKYVKELLDKSDAE